MAEFYITSTITFEAENREAADKLLSDEQSGEGNYSIADDLLRNSEIDEA